MLMNFGLCASFVPWGQTTMDNLQEKLQNSPSFIPSAAQVRLCGCGSAGPRRRTIDRRGTHGKRDSSGTSTRGRVGYDWKPGDKWLQWAQLCELQWRLRHMPSHLPLFPFCFLALLITTGAPER